MKLDGVTQRRVNATNTTLRAALELAREGWYVFPLRPGAKTPGLPRSTDCPKTCHGECGKDGHGAWDGTRDENTIRRWWGTHPDMGIGGETIDLVVIDLDVQHGADETLPYPDTRTHLSGRGNGNRHLVYRAPEGGLAQYIHSGTNVLGPGIDIRAAGGSYVVLPPTQHPDTGAPYTVANPHTPIRDLTDEDINTLWAAAGATPPAAPARERKRGNLRLAVDNSHPDRTPNTGSVPLDILMSTPAAEGGRNEWLTRVCGHAARMFHDVNAYHAFVAMANRSLPDPLPPFEVSKTADSVWRTDQDNHHDSEPGAMSADTGWLRGDGGRLLCQTRETSGGAAFMSEAEFANFDMHALGVTTCADGTRTIRLMVEIGERKVQAVVEESRFGDDRWLAKWLAGYGASVAVPNGAYPMMPVGVRLHRYLDSQSPRVTDIATHMGWDAKAGGFVTTEGMITADGRVPRDEAPVVLDPTLEERALATFRYGFEGTAEEARSVLREVLTFQEEETASVFGAWWAACWLRPQIQAESSLFPFFGLEATAESGKTTGFFGLMVQLNGSTRGQTAPTRAVMRDAMSANSSGIVWVDDMDDLSAYGELLRASTTSGTVSKMAADNTRVTSTRVVAPVLVSGEALGLSTQKALADRSYVLGVGSPKGRRSLRGDYPQWDDVLALMSRYPSADGGLAVLSGWLLQEALGHQADVVRVLHGARREARGRFGDRMAVLKAGARLLDALVGCPSPWAGAGEYASRVDAWVARQAESHLDGDNSLTMTLAPWALRQWGFPEAPEVADRMGRFAGIDTPVFVLGADDPVGLGGSSGPQVWVSPSLLADAWARERGGRVSERTETASALAQQADVIGAVSESQVVRGSNRRLVYRLLPGAYSAVVLDRARG